MGKRDKRKKKQRKQESIQAKSLQHNTTTSEDTLTDTDKISNNTATQKTNPVELDTADNKQTYEDISPQPKAICSYSNIMQTLRKYFPEKDQYRIIKEYNDFKINNSLDTDISSPNGFPINHIHINGNDTFVQLKDMGIDMWLNTKGDLCYRLSPDANTITNSLSKASIVFSSLLKKNIKIVRWHDKLFKKPPPIMNRDEAKSAQCYIVTMFLMMVQKEVFNPAAREEFFSQDNLYYKNLYKPTRYRLKFDYSANNPEHSLIVYFLYTLVNKDKDRFFYILNWIANLFINLTKSKVSLVLYSKEDTSFNILFEQILQPLLGMKYSVKIDEKELANNFPSILENKILYNFNNITSADINKENTSVFGEKLLYSDKIFTNNTNEVKQIDTYGQVLITSTTPYIPLIDKKINNFTIFEVKEFDIELFHKELLELKLIDNTLRESIENNLSSFANILRHYPIDTKKANNPYDKEDDRDNVINNDKNILELFTDALINKDEIFFQRVQSEHELYEKLLDDFDKDRVDRINLISYFKLVFEGTTHKTNRSLLKELKENKTIKYFYNDENVISNSGRKFFKILRTITLKDEYKTDEVISK